MHWSVAEAKQRLSEVLRRANHEGPQLIFNRGSLAAAVLDPVAYEAFEEWNRKRHQSVAQATEPIRLIAAEDGWELETEHRSDRPNAFDEMLSELERDGAL